MHEYNIIIMEEVYFKVVDYQRLKPQYKSIFKSFILAINGNIELSPTNAFGFWELNPSIR